MHASWLDNVFEPEKFSVTVNELAKIVRRFTTVKHIVVTGVSGNVVGGALSYVTGLPVTVIRKPNEGSHSDHSIESALDNHEPYIFVDDLMSSGSTLRRVIHSMAGQTPHVIALYSDWQDAYQGGYTNKYIDPATDKIKPIRTVAIGHKIP